MYELIGQTNLMNKIMMTELSHFTILWGDKGSGKRSVATAIAKEKKLQFVEKFGSIDEIREIIEESIGSSVRTLYYLKGDTISIQAQNALLKIAEEPPANTYICIGVTDIHNILSTIVSRGKLFIMDNYSPEELGTMYDRLSMKDVSKDLICSVSNTPGQMIEFLDNDFNDMYEYALKVYRNILKVTTGNAFKICNQLAFKDGEGYPVELFLALFMRISADKLEYDRYMTNKMVEYTSDALKDMRIRGANKALIFDIWVLNIRKLR